MRRGVGVSRTVKRNKAKTAFQEKGKELTDVKIGHMEQQLESFKKHLEEFAKKHKKQINDDPQFRKQFQIMCAKIGVDPLASNKGFWAKILGVGDFYFELAVQIIHVCLATRSSNGGLMDIRDLFEYLQRVRSTQQATISVDDIKRSIDKLDVLGKGLRVMQIGSRKIVVSVPTELTADHTSLIQAGQATGYITKHQIKQNLKWDDDRVERTLNLLLVEGMVWVDSQGNDLIQNNSTMDNNVYWFPSIFTTMTS